MLLESPSFRQSLQDNVEALDKVGALAFLPDGVHATTEMVADYYEVSVETVKSLVKNNQDEIESNGYMVYHGEQLRSLKDLCQIKSRAKSLALFNQRAILNVGMLLTKSPVAEAVRRYLLELQTQAPKSAVMSAWKVAREGGKATRKNFAEVLKEVYDSGDNDKTFAVWMSIFTKNMTKWVLKLSEAEYKQRKGKAKNFRDIATAEELKQLDNYEAYIVSHRYAKQLSDIRELYYSSKELCSLPGKTF